MASDHEPRTYIILYSFTETNYVTTDDAAGTGLSVPNLLIPSCLRRRPSREAILAGQTLTLGHFRIRVNSTGGPGGTASSQSGVRIFCESGIHGQGSHNESAVAPPDLFPLRRSCLTA